MPRRYRSCLIALATVAAALSAAPKAQALEYYWRGGASDDWNAYNWDGWIDGSYFGSNTSFGDDIYFGSKGYHDDNGIVDYGDPLTTGSLNFAQQDWTLNLEGVGFDNGQINVNSTSSNVTLNLQYGLSWGFGFDEGSLSMDVEGSSVLALNGNVYGGGGMYKYGTGTVVITSPYYQQLGSPVGGTNIFGGRLITDNPTSNYNDNADLEFVTPSYRSDLTFGGKIYGTGNFTKSGDATLTLTGADTYTGATTVSAGRLVMSGFSSSGVSVNDGATLELRTNASTTYAGNITGNGSVVKSGTGTYTLTGTSTYVGGTTVNAGTLVDGALHGDYAVASGANLQGLVVDKGFGDNYLVHGGTISGAGSFTKSGTGILYLAGLNTYTGGTTVSAGRLVDLNPHGNYTTNADLEFSLSSNLIYSGAITGTGSFTKSDGGDLVLTNVNGYTGGTVVSGGRLIDQQPHGNYEAASGTVLELAPTNYTDFSGVISGDGSFVSNARTYLFLDSKNTYGGSTTVAGGELYLGIDDALPASTDLIMDGGRFQMGSHRQTIASLSGSSNINLLGGTLTVDGSASTTYSGLISNGFLPAPGALVKAGSGTLTLTGGNLYTSGTTVNGGRLIDLNPHGAYVTNADLEFAKAGDYTYATPITGGGAFTKSGAGTLTLSGANTYAGGTTVSAGRLIDLSPHGDYVTNATLEFANDADSTYKRTIDGTGTFVKSGAGTLSLTGSIKPNVATQIAGGTLKASGSALQGNVAGAAGTTLQLDGTNDGTFLGTFSGAGALLKTGTRTFTLMNAPANAGGVRVSGGTLDLRVGGAFAGGLTVDSGATFQNAAAGTLTVGGPTAVQGTVGTSSRATTAFTGLVSGAGNFTGTGTVRFDGGYSPGNSPASVKFQGGLTLGATNTLTMELGGTTLGTGYDHLTVAGLATLGGKLSVAYYGGFAASAGQSFDLFDFAQESGTFSSVSLPALGNGLRWDTSALYTTGVVRTQAVPEPASLAALGLGALVLLRRRRR